MSNGSVVFNEKNQQKCGFYDSTRFSIDHSLEHQRRSDVEKLISRKKSDSCNLCSQVSSEDGSRDYAENRQEKSSVQLQNGSSSRDTRHKGASPMNGKYSNNHSDETKNQDESKSVNSEQSLDDSDSLETDKSFDLQLHGSKPVVSPKRPEVSTSDRSQMNASFDQSEEQPSQTDSAQSIPKRYVVYRIETLKWNLSFSLKTLLTSLSSQREASSDLIPDDESLAQNVPFLITPFPQRTASGFPSSPLVETAFKRTLLSSAPRELYHSNVNWNDIDENLQEEWIEPEQENASSQSTAKVSSTKNDSSAAISRSARSNGPGTTNRIEGAEPSPMPWHLALQNKESHERQRGKSLEILFNPPDSLKGLEMIPEDNEQNVTLNQPLVAELSVQSKSNNGNGTEKTDKNSDTNKTQLNRSDESSVQQNNVDYDQSTQETKSTYQQPVAQESSTQNLSSDPVDSSVSNMSQDSAEKDSSQISSSSSHVSSSPLKLFRKHDTYTNSKFEGLLGSLDTRDSKQSSVKQAADGATKLTKEDFMKDADFLFEQIKSTGIPAIYDEVASNFTSDDYSNSSREPTDENSLNELEKTLQQHRPDANSSSDTSSQHYYNSVKGKYERSASSLRYEESTSEQENRQERHLKSLPESHESELESDYDQKVPLPQRQSPKSHHQKPKGLNHISPEEFQKLNAGKAAELSFNKEKLQWQARRQNSKDFGTGSTKVGDNSHFFGDSGTEDPFDGIEDLKDSQYYTNTVRSRHDHYQPTQGDFEDELESRYTITKSRLDEPPSELRAPSSDSRSSVVIVPKARKVSDYVGKSKKISLKSNMEPGINSRPSSTSQRSHRILPSSPPESTPLTADRTRWAGKTNLFKSVNGRGEASYIPSSAMRDYTLGASKGCERSAVSQTNSSFSNGFNNLVKMLTEVCGPEVNWEQYTEVDLKGKHLKSMSRLLEIMPHLRDLNVSFNELRAVMGAPSTLQKLDISNNLISDVTPFQYLINLHSLNLASNGGFQHLQGLSGLLHLRELNVDHNNLNSLGGISKLEGLQRLSCNGNNISQLQLENMTWPNLQELYLNHNQIVEIHGLEHLPKLRTLNVDANKLVSVSCNKLHGYLRTLSLNDNSLVSIDVSPFRQLKILRVDRNLEIQILGIRKVRDLEVLCLRGQRAKNMKLRERTVMSKDSQAFEMTDWTSICDIRVLRFSGNPIINTSFPIEEPFMNLHILDLSGTNLTRLPATLGELCINLRELDLSFNEISDIEPLISVPKLERLYLFHNKLDNLEQVIEILLGMSYLTILDLRDNPLTHSLYPSVINEDQLELPYLAYRQSRTSVKRREWFQRDLEYKYQLRQLAPDLHRRRMLYQGAVLASAVRNGRALQYLDGIEFDFKSQQQLLMDARAANL